METRDCRVASALADSVVMLEDMQAHMGSPHAVFYRNVGIELLFSFWVTEEEARGRKGYYGSRLEDAAHH